MLFGDDLYEAFKILLEIHDKKIDNNDNTNITNADVINYINKNNKSSNPVSNNYNPANDIICITGSDRIIKSPDF